MPFVIAKSLAQSESARFDPETSVRVAVDPNRSIVELSIRSPGKPIKSFESQIDLRIVRAIEIRRISHRFGNLVLLQMKSIGTVRYVAGRELPR